MNIMYASDDNYAWLMGISMISLFENNKASEEVNVFLFGDNLSEENENILSGIADKYGRKFMHIDVEKVKIPDYIMSERYPKSTYSRLFAYDLLPSNVKKLIYLDCDIIVSGSLEDMFNRDVEGKAFLAVKDCVSKAYKRKIGLKASDTYINAGVLLMNLDRLREIPIAERMKAFVDKYSSAMSYADQEIVNSIFQGDFGILPPEYDVMTMESEYTYRQLCLVRHPHHYYTKEEIEFAKANPRIIHYTTCMLNIRPWFKNSKHSHAWRFDKYMAMSPWKDKEKKEMSFSDKKYQTMRILEKLPNWLKFPLLGLLHSYLRPYYMLAKTQLS